jgi:hypothetical protein
MLGMGLLSRVRTLGGSAVGASETVVIGQPATPIPWERLFGAALSAGADPTWFLSGAVPRDLALSLPVVRKGLLVFDLLGGCPLTRWRGGEKIDPGTILTQPETWCAPSTTVAGLVRDLVLYPHAWWLVIEREWTGYPRHVQRLDPEYVQVQTEPGTEGRPARTFATYRGAEVDSADLIRFDSPDRGLLFHGRATIIRALALEASAEKATSPSEVPDGVITSQSEYQLNPDEARAVLDEWAASRAERRTAFLQNASYNVTAFDPTKVQLLESREYADLELARMMGLPPRYVGVAARRDSMTYSTVVEERRDLIDISFAPYVAAIEQRLSMSDRNGSPNGQTIEFDYTSFLRGSPADRTARAVALVPLGVMSRQEARAAEPDLTGPAPQVPDPTPAAGQPPAQDPALPPVQPNNPDEAT